MSHKMLRPFIVKVSVVGYFSLYNLSMITFALSSSIILLMYCINMIKCLYKYRYVHYNRYN